MNDQLLEDVDWDEDGGSWEPLPDDTATTVVTALAAVCLVLLGLLLNL